MTLATETNFALPVPTLRDRAMAFIKNPWVDKAIATIAAFPFIYPIIHHFQRFGFNVPDVVYVIQSSLLVGTMMFRRAPVRVTTNPIFWVLAFVATYWGLFAVSLSGHGTQIAPSWLLNTITVASLFGILWARFSLGRNIGFVPAQREIVTRGAYRLVRHPIYGVVFISVFGEALQSFSLRNVLLLSVGVTLFAVKSLVEENLLKQDPQYAAYMKKVRYRWIPGIV